MAAAAQASLVPLAELTDADFGRWRALADATAEPNPFFEPEFVSALAPVLGSRDLSLLVVRRGSDWLAVAPVHRPSRWSRLPLRGIVTWRTPYTYLGSPLFLAAEAEGALEQLTTTALDTSGTYFGLDLLPADSDAAAGLASRVPPAQSLIFKRFQRAVLMRRDDASYIAIKAKHRREIQRLGRRLQEHLDQPLEVVDLADDERGVDDFLELEASGWKGRRGTAMAQLEGHGRFFRDLCRGFARMGRLQLLALRAGDRSIALKCNLRAGAHVYCFKIAYDDAFARFSPGMQLELANIEGFESDPEITLMDSCAEPNNQMINRLWAERREYISLVLGTPSAIGRATLLSLRLGAAARSRRTRDADDR